MKSKKTDKNLF